MRDPIAVQARDPCDRAATDSASPVGSGCGGGPAVEGWAAVRKLASLTALAGLLLSACSSAAPAFVPPPPAASAQPTAVAATGPSTSPTAVPSASATPAAKPCNAFPADNVWL